jgi:hypothetical protein
MIIRKEIDLSSPLTAEQTKMLKDLETRPVQVDKDCPELTSEQFVKLARVFDKKS